MDGLDIVDRNSLGCSVVSSRDESDWYWRLSVLCEIFEKSARWNTRYPIENEYVALKARPRLRVLQIQRILSWSSENVWKPAADEIADIPPITTSVILYGTVLSFSLDEKKKKKIVISRRSLDGYGSIRTRHGIEFLCVEMILRKRKMFQWFESDRIDL